MAFTGNYVCNTFKAELLTAWHDFNTFSGHTPDVFKMALYNSLATLNANTTSYITGGEISSSGTGYTAGGKALTLPVNYPALVGGVAFIDFEDLTWPAATFTGANAVRGALIYNSTPGGGTNPALVVLDFLADKTSVGGDFTVVFPQAVNNRAIIRIT